MNTNPTAPDAYLARATAIHAKLARLEHLADDHFGHDPDAIHWGHVGDLGRWTPRSMTCWRSSAANMREATVMITLQKLTPTQSTLSDLLPGTPKAGSQCLPPCKLARVQIPSTGC